MIINHNMGAMNANRQMGINQANAGKSMEKLSSGLRINKAGDDAAGLAISEKMRGQIRGLDQASANAQDGISMIGTAEGALNETTSILQRMRELAVQSSNDTNTTDDRTQIQKEMNQLTSETSRIGNNTEFNTQKLLNGTSGVVTASKITTPAVPAVAGVATLTNAALAAGTVTIDGIDLTVGAGTDVDSRFALLKTAIEADATLSAKYTVGAYTAADNKLTLTQKGGQEGATAITSTGTTAATTTVGSKGTAAITTAASSAFTYQIGANQGQQFTASISDMRSAALGLSGTAGGAAAGVGATAVVGASYVATGVANDLSDVSTAGEHALDVSDATKATAAIKVLDAATASVSAERAKLGAYSNRLEHTIANLGTSSENLTSAESRIRDVNMAKEMSTFSKNNILSQAAQAMLSQANQQPQQVLQLLR
ncbi:flagellin [Clostridium gasigenes]|uniref:flagellin N-terminal helical domain-containing protein n=1 Tax=Clostridium gasigenes TaxID=94869 RepID=UPI00143869F5|nr:flagellin [Clostridium gasigenes]NKF06932.1 flagellin [Clostridium gasigenes]QSW19805.1 flagellin [Clostridium gasigenes]